MLEIGGYYGNYFRKRGRGLGILEEDEKILEGVQQAGFGGKITGVGSVFVTNKRMIKLKPKTLGLRSEIEDYLYKDIANVKLNTGILRSSIHIVTRFRTEPIIIENIPKESANKIFKIIQKGIDDLSITTKSEVVKKNS